MKNIYTLLVITSTVMLSACSTQPSTHATSKTAVPMENQAKIEHSQAGIDTISSIDDVNVKPDQSAETNLTATKLTKSDSKATSKVYLSVKNNQLIAKTVTDWNGAVVGDIYLKWIAPKDTACRSTKVKINKYGEKHDYSIAKRSIDHLYSNSACKGIWRVEIVTKNGKVLANASTNTI